MLRFEFDPVQMSAALSKLAAVPTPNSGKSSVELTVGMNSRILVSRSSRTESLTFEVPVEGLESGMPSVIVEEERFVGAVGKGVGAGHNVEFKVDMSTSSAIISQGKAKKFKIPTVRPASHPKPNLVMASGDRTHEWEIKGEQLMRFTSALQFAKIFMADKIVGQGKFSGVTFFPNRIVSCSYDGVSESAVELPIPGSLGVPMSTCKILANLTKETFHITVNNDDKIEQGVRAVQIDGVIDGLPWCLRFEMIQPALSFTGHDLSHGPYPIKSPDFVADFEVVQLVDAVQSVASMLEKTESHLEITTIAEKGIVLRAIDAACVAESVVQVGAIESHKVPEKYGPIKLSRKYLLEALESMPKSGRVTLTFDTRNPYVFGVTHRETKSVCVLAMVSMGDQGN
jgi:hypothetical protein